MSLPVLSGVGGVIGGMSSVTNWSINRTQASAKYAASSTKGGTGRVPGPQDYTGSFTTLGHTPPAMPGETVPAVLKIGQTDPAVGAEKAYYIMPLMLIDSVQITIDWGSADPITCVTNFSAQVGSLAEGVSDDNVHDLTAPTVFPVCGLSLSVVDDAANVLEWPNIVRAVLTISSENQSYTNSSTGCAVGRLAGNLDWTLAITENNYNFNSADETDLGKTLIKDIEQYIFRMQVAAGIYWELAYGMIREFTGLTVDVSTGAIVQRTVNVDMNYNAPAGLGYIKRPGDAVNWWPA